MPAEFSGDPYALLGVPRTASDAEVKDAFRRLAKATHPDVDARPEAMAQMVLLNQAHDLLTDPLRRQRWDALHPLPRPGAPAKPGPPGKPGTSTWPAPPGKRPTTASPTSRPTGPTSATGRPAPAPRPMASGNPYPNPPTLEEALAFRVGFGAYHGRTLREVAMDDPGYLDWIIRSINDRPRLVACAKLVRKHLAELDRSASPAPPAPNARGRTSAAPPAPPTGLTATDRLRGLIAGDRAVMMAVVLIAALVTFLLAVVLILVMSAG